MSETPLVLVPDPTPEEVKEKRRLHLNERKRLWRGKNPERYLAIVRKYRAKKLHRWNTKSREYKDFRNAQQRAWRHKNPEKQKEYERRYEERNPERRREQIARWRRENREKIRRIKLQKKYGLTPESLLAILAEQGGRCAICLVHLEAEPRRGQKRLCVDHDHDTGAVRGLLCWHCNPGLGQFGDDPKLLIRAAMYLEKHKGKNG